ncbi:ABC transporter ATP-binding protein [Acetonema longum]|uniref:ABC transporter permease n=1 Tax=Acetonema longum TaxID=2374 RepID=UPI0002FF9E68|nr:ABC transporter ATP-binding protein [Acetonema longum]
MERDNRENDVFPMLDNMPAGKAKNAKGTTARLLKQLSRQKWQLLAAFVCIVFGSAFTLAAPLIIGQTINLIYDGITSGRPFEVNVSTLGGIMLTLLTLYLFSAVFSYLQEFTLAGVAQMLTLSLREKISEKLTRLPLRYYDQHKKGDILSRATNDLDKVASTLEDGLLQFFSATVSIVGSFALMLAISPRLTLIALATVSVSMAAATWIARKTQRYYAENQKALGEMNGTIEEAFTGHQVIKAFNMEQDAIRNVAALNQALYKARQQGAIHHLRGRPGDPVMQPDGLYLNCRAGRAIGHTGQDIHRQHPGFFPVCQSSFGTAHATGAYCQCPAGGHCGGGTGFCAAG